MVTKSAVAEQCHMHGVGQSSLKVIAKHEVSHPISITSINSGSSSSERGAFIHAVDPWSICVMHVALFLAQARPGP